MTRRVLITGGAGFVGSHLVERLRPEWEIVVVDDFSTGNRQNLPTPLDRVKEIDITRDDLTESFTGVTHVVHLAALVSVPLSIKFPARNHSINVEGTRKVLAAAEAAGVRRIVLASSAAVYGDLPGLPKLESDEVKPQSPYAHAKLANEVDARKLAENSNTDTVSLRFFNVFGERQDPSSMYSGVISKFCDCFQKDESPLVFGDGFQTRDFVYAADVAQAIERCLEDETPFNGDVLNVGTGKADSLLDLLELLSRLSGKELKPSFRPSREGDIRHSVADVSALEERTGFAPEFDFEQGLKRTIEFLSDVN